MKEQKFFRPNFDPNKTLSYLVVVKLKMNSASVAKLKFDNELSKIVLNKH